MAVTPWWSGNRRSPGRWPTVWQRTGLAPWRAGAGAGSRPGGSPRPRRADRRPRRV